MDEYNASADKYNEDVADYNDKANAYNEKVQEEYESAKREYDEAKAAYEEDLKKYEEDSKQYESDNAAYQQYLKDKEAYEKAYADYLAALEQYEKDNAQYEKDDAAYQQYLKDKEAYDKAYEEYLAALEQYEKDSAQYVKDDAAYQQYLKDKAAYDKAYADYLAAMEQYKKDKAAYNDYLAAKKTYDDAKAAFHTAHDQWVIESGIYEDVVDYNDIIDTKNAGIAAKNDALKDSIVSGTVEDASKNDQAIKDNVNTTAAVSESVKSALAQYTVLQAKKAALVAMKSEIESYSGKIGDEDYDDYLNKVKEYNTLVDEYNKDIQAYNAAVDTYNSAVDNYNSTKDTEDITNGSTETGTADWGNIKTDSKLTHIDVKYSAASTKTVETVKDEEGNIISTEYTDTVTGYTVTGIYPTSDSKSYGVNYTSNGIQKTHSLQKSRDEFTSIRRNLSFKGDSVTVSFYMTVEDSAGKETGLTIQLDPSSVYPKGTYYNGSNAGNLARYKDSEGNSIPTVTIDGKKYYDISGMSVFVVSTMTCDGFRWETKSGKTQGKPNGLDLVLSLQTLFDIHKAASEKTLAFLSYESQLKANAELGDEPKFDMPEPDKVGEPTEPTAPEKPDEVEKPTAPTAPELTVTEPDKVGKPTPPTAPTAPNAPTEVKNPGDAPTMPVFDKTAPTAPTLLGMLENVERLDQLTEYEQTTVVIPGEEEPEEEADDALPQTGQNWAAAALLALGGMFVTAAGWIRRKSEENA